MKLKFDSDLPHQLDAIRAVIDVFAGQATDAPLDFTPTVAGGLFHAVSNHLSLSDAQLLQNVQTVQKNNDVEISARLEEMSFVGGDNDNGNTDNASDTDAENRCALNFSIEMETGTGKTYVYLRTIYELHQQYGFKKFVIVVPSVAIREGVLKNLQITHEHLQSLYNRPPATFRDYHRRNSVSALRSFAANDNIEILLLNIDSFAKDENVINKLNETGRKPIEFIRAVRPIVLVDEPQNMETEKRRKAIISLNPLCTLRYSATHRTPYNLLYSLNPVNAYDLGLVKQIEVDSVIEEDSQNDAFVTLEKITTAKTQMTAKISIFVNGATVPVKKSINITFKNWGRQSDADRKRETDLYLRSNQRDVYKGWVIEEIDAVNQVISFTNGRALWVGETQGNLGEEVMKFQIERTIREHLDKSVQRHPAGIKVLSLFFIDKVANYRSYDEAGNPQAGKFALWFSEFYAEISKNNKYKDLPKFAVEQVHNGYFSQDKNKKLKDTSGETQADDDTYKLIMRDKEKLLDINEPLQFIFSHSALREGWDNPNVFQICTLNETKSEMKKRQEIGRGLRLAVNQNGERSHDKSINILTVIANESYHDFAQVLQREIEEDCGVNFTGRIKNKKERKVVSYRKGFDLDPNFLDIWNKIKHKTSYCVYYTTDELIKKATAEFAHIEITAPRISATKVKIAINQDGVLSGGGVFKSHEYDAPTWTMPDVVRYIQERTKLSCDTIFQIIKRANQFENILINPQLFMDSAVVAIKKVLHDLLIDGIKYEKIGDHVYEMKLFTENELTAYFTEYTHTLSDNRKTIYADIIPLDSQVENKFASDCENYEQIKFFFKLPSWFIIPTPIGDYNPDWAIVFEDDVKVYFVAETKNTGGKKIDRDKLRPAELQKIKCGEKCFADDAEVEFEVVQTVNEVLQKAPKSRKRKPSTQA